MRIPRISSAVGVVALLLVGALPAAAQQVGILIYRLDRLLYANPAFLEPLAQPYTPPTNRGRKGLAGWTSPTTPAGPSSMYSEWTGVLAVGFSVTWDGPPPTPKRPAP